MHGAVMRPGIEPSMCNKVNGECGRMTEDGARLWFFVYWETIAESCDRVNTGGAEDALMPKKFIEAFTASLVSSKIAATLGLDLQTLCK